MDITFDEKDALCEVSNISMGAAACQLGNASASDVDISVPYIMDSDELDGEFEGKSLVYKLSFTAFTAGYVVAVLKDNFEQFRRLMEYTPDSIESLYDALNRVLELAVDPLCRLTEQKITIKQCKKSDDSWECYWNEDNTQVMGVRFKAVIDGCINFEMIYVYPLSVAKALADRFVINGVALTTV